MRRILLRRLPITWFVFLLLSLELVSCSRNNHKQQVSGDSLFLQEAIAQTDTSQIRRVNERLHRARETAITRAVAIASPAVVGINVLQVRRIVQKSPFDIDDPLWRAIFPELFRDRVIEQRIKSLGSGFIISPDGYLVTNEHVVEDAEKIVVTLPGGKRYNAKLVGSDRVTDIALLKIDGKNLPYLKPGNSDDLILGEWVIALGNPFGFFELNKQPTVTVGVISAVNMDWGRTESGRLYMDMIQTNADINHGNSGGPLVNVLGQVIGMNTFIYTGSRYQEGFIGIGFAIPINRIVEVVKEIKEKGGINRDYWLGILKVQDVDRLIMKALDLPVDYGALIVQVEPGSPAAKAGLQEEDLIVAVEGQKVTDAQSLVDQLKNMDLRVGSIVTFTVYRGHQKMQVRVKLESLPR